MKSNITRLCLLLWALCALGSADAQWIQHERFLSFEEEAVPAFISTDSRSALAVSPRHFREGVQSLEWTFTPGSELSVRKDLKFEKKDPTGKDTYMSAFIVWVYNDRPLDKQIEFRFLKEGRTCCSFPMGINFKGWRAAWVCYERDMEGTPEEGMDEFRVVAPDVEGHLYFDHIITASKVDARQQSPDIHLPFVNRETTNHWLVVYAHSLWKPEMELIPLTDAHKKDIRIIEKRFRDQLYTPSKLTEREMKAIRKKYDFYRIRREEGCTTGRPVFYCRHSEAYERMLPDWHKDLFQHRKIEMNDYFKLMQRVAIAYQNAVEPAWKDELRDKFLALYENITDQGVAYGSAWGNIHHYGYSTRGLFVSYFLMKNVLRKAGYLEDAVRTLNWYAITNEVYPLPQVDGIDIDTFNTKLQGRFASILIMEDSPEKVRYLRSLTRWLDYGCRPAPGLRGSFKKDGACFHHCNNYPAYAVGGLEGATNAIFLLSGTQFRLSELSHQTVKNVLLTMRFYCNLRQWPLSMSGRHPNSKGKLIPVEYATMAFAGTPDGKQKYDREMAEAFLRLVATNEGADKQAPDYMPRASSKTELRFKKQLEAKGFKPEADPQGNLSLGYGCVSVQRRSNWSAVARGHSRYLWAAEHYLPANFYGRYLAHGSLQIMTARPGEEVTMRRSGWQEQGFDWNRIPGATSIHLPFDLLRARVLNVDTYSGIEEMLYSDEAFAGGLTQNRENGNFGMKLHEHDKYNGSHRARKSYHFLGDVIVALGSDIENDNRDYPTETTIFQLAAASPEWKSYWEGYTSDGRSYIDPNGVGYYVSEQTARETRYEKNFPQTTVGERSTKPTTGDWVSLTVQHGKAPKGGGYEYAVLPQTTAARLKAFARKPSYKVLRRDHDAHIVRSEQVGMTSYVLFETPREELPREGEVMRADTSCLVMTRQMKGGRLLLTVSQPDLALYRGQSDEAFDENGKRIERSIYSRPWINNDSGEIPVTVTLRGNWTAETLPANCEVIARDKNSTTLRFVCRDAASFEVMLKK